MTERALQFGPGKELVGVFDRPEGVASPRLAFVLFNAGVLTRIGPHRMNVKLARALGRAGHASLRFDLSGQGDSRLGAAGADFRAQAVSDLRCAMDHLERNEGIARFALIGICSGAVTALRAAVEDARVAGVLMFDGNWYPARWTVLARRWKRWRNLPWSSVAAQTRQRFAALFGAGERVAVGGDAPIAVQTDPPREVFVRWLQALAERRVATYLIYSGSVLDEYSYAGQFRDAFGREPFFANVRCDFRPDIDHTFLSLETQRRMVGLVEHWVGDVERACEPLP